jgi:hypothetical protein
MILKRELRIGNLISRADLASQEPRFETIIELGEKAVTSGPIKVICDYKDLNPIPLTEDILLKCGFKKIGTNFENGFLILHGNLKTGTFDFLLNIPNESKYNVTVIQHLHQLQNLYFALTNQELEIKL